MTDAVLEEVAAWQARPLEAVYPLVFLDALRVEVRDEGLVRDKAVHIALGVRADSRSDVRVEGVHSGSAGGVGEPRRRGPKRTISHHIVAQILCRAAK